MTVINRHAVYVKSLDDFTALVVDTAFVWGGFVGSGFASHWYLIVSGREPSGEVVQYRHTVGSARSDSEGLTLKAKTADLMALATDELKGAGLRVKLGILNSEPVEGSPMKMTEAAHA